MGCVATTRLRMKEGASAPSFLVERDVRKLNTHCRLRSIVHFKGQCEEKCLIKFSLPVVR